MAKRCYWPALWLLFLALALRAESLRGQSANYPRRTSTSQSQWVSNSTRHATTNRARLEDSEVDYALSGEPFIGDRTARRTGDSKPSLNWRGGGNFRQPPTAEVAQAPLEYYGDAPFIEEDYPIDGPAGEPLDPRGYSSDAYAEEMLGEEMMGSEDWEAGPHGDSPESHGKLHYFLKSFLPEHGHWFRTSKNSPRSTGMGEPLKGTSWLNRPNSISFFAGILNGDELIANRVDQGSALFGGLRLGWDFDHYWGMEVRAGWSSPELEYDPPPTIEHVDGIFLCDASFLYYPWGDSSWRPYGLLGMGMARFDFTDELGFIHDEYLLGIPVGFGMKYMYHPNLVFRAEFLNNIACASSGLENMNNLSFTLGMELRYGGKPRSYYPWQPAKYIW